MEEEILRKCECRVCSGPVCECDHIEFVHSDNDSSCLANMKTKVKRTEAEMEIEVQKAKKWAQKNKKPYKKPSGFKWERTECECKQFKEKNEK